jgi:AraC family transcriptional regulator
MCPSHDETQQDEYISRLNRVIDYIQNHYDEELNLTKLAEVACFSKFHFHRLFRTLVGETLNEFVRRVRLEKSIQKLTRERSKSITQIALDCGFSSSQNFAKIFKSQFGVPPSVFRDEYNWDNWKIKIENLRTKDKQGLDPFESFLYDIYREKRQLPMNKILGKWPVENVKVVDWPPFHVAYVRSIGPYKAQTIQPAYKKLLQWAAPRGLANEKMIVLGVFWSNPDITPEDRLIHDACIIVPESVKADRWVNTQVLPGGKFAIHHCEIEAKDNDEAWMNFIMNWLISSNYQPDDRPNYQIHYNDPETHPLKHLILDLCMPVKPLYE